MATGEQCAGAGVLTCHDTRGDTSAEKCLTQSVTGKPISHHTYTCDYGPLKVKDIC